MNKIYKVKKNAAGHSVACSEFAKGHTKKAVLGSLLIVGILGMATTASAQNKTSNTTNKISGKGTHIGGGDYNEANGTYLTIGGGFFNEAIGKYSTIGGGYINIATNEYSTVGGGDNNLATGKYSTIGGGGYNEATNQYSTIGGGDSNTATGIYSTIAGGRDNQATKGNSTVGGGELNQATGYNSTVAGGYKNEAIGDNSTIAGGRNNQAKGKGSFAAGVDNQANTDNAVALGKNNIINGNNSAAIGSNNTIGSGKQDVFILGSNTDTKDAQSGSVLLGNETAGKVATVVKDATVGDLSLTGFAGSEANSGTVSVGKKGKERQIVHVGAGQINAKSTDAVNGSQLHALATAVAKNKADIKDLDDEVGLLGEEISSLEGEIFNNQDAIAKNQADIKTLESNVEEGLLDLSGRLLDQKADIDNNINNIYELAQQQDQHSSDIKTLKNNVEEGLLDLSGRLIDQKADIAKNQADIQLHDKKITNLGILHSMVARAVGNNTQGVATNKADIAKNQADIANNIKNIYELAQQQDQHSSDIKTLAKVSAANTDRIAKNKAEADASFETLTKNQNTLIEQGEALVEQNKAINQELEGFAAHADVQDKQILQNQADITTNKTAIEQNINRTVANGFEIEKNKAGIATNKQELILQNDRLNRINETNNHQDQKIDQLGYALKEQGQHFNNRISAVERQTAGGIANAIAIATLPSPSRAGEHHVLFGSGYHNGQAAVSLGAAGLSDTGKSTYKIGLSWSDAGGLSGGVGGSYRWK
ncbi:YadA-like family protein [Moraxella catarrhalis]|uniref:YadA-like family protein n=1 Tax=Moraxella catarrhalis TaxID=480 RepID=UPI001EEF359D|nr:YadA-like family protein [Moraxella catarrhalis]MCG6832534.1 YadA-like family protein [Moraxella catarrhalis]